MLGAASGHAQFPAGFWPEFSTGGGKSWISDSDSGAGGGNTGPDFPGIGGDGNS
jgi:hypothetical protein